MCRMIAAVGDFEAGRLIDGLRVMAENTNSAQDHEFRHLGEGFQHACGWGALYREDGALVRRRSTLPCFQDEGLAALAGLRSDLLVLHARRTKDRSTISEKNTHPFLAQHQGAAWGFCHNGDLRDLSQLTCDPILRPVATIDSERLFFHVLTRLDRSDPCRSFGRLMGELRDFTSLNSILAGERCVVAYARKDPAGTLPRYYTLWHGRGRGFDVVSSEIVSGIDVRWEAVPDAKSVPLEPDGRRG